MHVCHHDGCTRAYKDKRDLQDHLRSKKHDPDKLLALKCDQCTDTFRSRVSLRQHKRRVHDKAKPKFKCDHPGCDYTADQSNNLTRHKRAVHQGIKNKFKVVECPLCASTLNETDLARHIRHNCPFGKMVRIKCRFCEQDYATRKARDDHENAIHHGFRRFVCEMCGKDYAYPECRIRCKERHKIVTTI